MNHTTAKLNAAFFSIFLLSSFGCDPGHVGKSFINNRSLFPLSLQYKSYYNDTVLLIQPNSLVEIFSFGGLGSGRDYDCCPCEFPTITLRPTDTSKTLVKSIADKSAWTLNNPNRRRFSNKVITCEFIIGDTDIK
jgi:hypothetical protein